MIEALVNADTWLLLKLNAAAANGVFDWIMPLITELRHWRPFIIAGLVAVAVFGGGRGRAAVVVAVLLLTITDQLSSHVVKPLAARPRPCHEVAEVRLLYRCGRTYSFPSTHAVNTMAAAVFFGAAYRVMLWPLLILAVAVSYSRVYLGVHYPLDVIAGWILGGGLALGAYHVFQRHLVKLLGRYRPFRPKSPSSSEMPTT